MIACLQMWLPSSLLIDTTQVYIRGVGGHAGSCTAVHSGHDGGHQPGAVPQGPPGMKFALAGYAADIYRDV